MGPFKKNSSSPVDSIECFDAIIRPEDSVEIQNEEIQHNVEVIKCPPIVMLDSNELLSRERVRSRLDLPLDAIVVYVQLGAGEINNIDSEIRHTIGALLKNSEVQIVVGESLIGKRIDIDLPRVKILRDYPNSMYFNGFDATVQAGGYNSFHETRNFGLPALFYPNMKTGMDDQLARCKVAEEEGWGIVLESRTENKIQKSCLELLKLVGNGVSHTNEYGAQTIASKLLMENKL